MERWRNSSASATRGAIARSTVTLWFLDRCQELTTDGLRSVGNAPRSTNFSHAALTSRWFMPDPLTPQRPKPGNRQVLRSHPNVDWVAIIANAVAQSASSDLTKAFQVAAFDRVQPCGGHFEKHLRRYSTQQPIPRSLPRHNGGSQVRLAISLYFFASSARKSQRQRSVK